jgi:hypothetical protein
MYIRGEAPQSTYWVERVGEEGNMTITEIGTFYSRKEE